MRPFSHNGPTCESYTHKMIQFLSQLTTWQVLNSRSVSPNVPIITHLPLITRYMASCDKSCVILCCPSITHEIRTYKRLVIIKVPTKFGRGSFRIEVLRWVLLQARGQSLGPDTRVPCKPDWDMLGPMIQSPLLKFFDWDITKPTLVPIRQSFFIHKSITSLTIIVQIIGVPI